MALDYIIQPTSAPKYASTATWTSSTDGTNFIQQVRLDAETLVDIAVKNGITFHDGKADEAGKYWDGTNKLDVVIPNISDLVQDPLQFIGVATSYADLTKESDLAKGFVWISNGTFTIAAEHSQTGADVSVEKGDMIVCTDATETSEKFSVIQNDLDVNIPDNDIILSTDGQAYITVNGTTRKISLPTLSTTNVASQYLTYSVATQTFTGVATEQTYLTTATAGTSEATFDVALSGVTYDKFAGATIALSTAATLSSSAAQYASQLSDILTWSAGSATQVTPAMNEAVTLSTNAYVQEANVSSANAMVSASVSDHVLSFTTGSFVNSVSLQSTTTAIQATVPASTFVASVDVTAGTAPALSLAGSVVTKAANWSIDSQAVYSLTDPTFTSTSLDGTATATGNVVTYTFGSAAVTASGTIAVTLGSSAVDGTTTVAIGYSNPQP
jgi:hypothetical protein